MEPIAPPNISSWRLIKDFRLLEDRQRDHPGRVPQSEEAAASRAAAGEVDDLVEEFLAFRCDRESHPARVQDFIVAEEHAWIAETLVLRGQRLPQRPRASGMWGLRGRRRVHRSSPEVGGLRAGRHEHDVVGRHRDRGWAVGALDVKAIDGHAARRVGEVEIADEGAPLEVHAVFCQPGDQRFDEGFVLVELRAKNVRHGRQVGKQVDEAIQVAPELDDGVLRQRAHQRRPEQPELRVEEPLGEPVPDELTV